MNSIKRLLLVCISIILFSCEEKECLLPELQQMDIRKYNMEIFPKGYFRIQINDELCRVIELNTQKNGDVKMVEISALSEIKDAIKIKSMKRTFPNAGKFEKRTRESGLHLWYDVYFDEDIDLYEAGSRFLKVDGVDYIDYIPKVKRIGSTKAIVANEKELEKNSKSSIFNDPYLSNQWHYINTGTPSGAVAGCDINVLPAWQLSITGNSSVIVAVVDGGIDVTHNDLKPNLWTNQAEISGTSNADDDNNGYADDKYGYNFVSGQGAVTADDHGTHVAGTVSARNNNGMGVCGVAGGNGSQQGALLMSCQIFEGEESAPGDVAIKYGADNGAVISQNSWGFQDITYVPGSTQSAINYFIQYAGKDENGVQVGPMNGGVVIFAAGNEEAEYGSPAAYEPVIAVAALAHDYEIAYYSNYGTWVDISAPGGDVYKGTQAQVLSTLPGNQYGYMQGTSMACPHVSGIAALAVSYLGAPGFTPADLKDKIFMSANDIIYDYNTTSFTNKLGAGLINTFDIISYANHPPLLLSEVDNKLYSTTDIGTEFAIDLTEYIFDEDDEQLEYTLQLNNQVFTYRLEGDMLYITPTKAGRASITLTATDGYELFVKSNFKIIVRDESQMVDIYPNPVSNYMYIQSGVENLRVNVSIIGASGATVYTKALTVSPFNPGQIKLTDIDAGVYTVKVESNGQESVSTIVKL